MSTPISQNLCHTIKRSKQDMHQMSHIVTNKPILANDRQHQSRPSRMSRGVCASARRHRRREKAGSISQALCSLGKKCRPTKKDIIHATLVVDRPHQSWIVHIALSTLFVVCPYRSWLVHNSQSLLVLGCEHRSDELNHGLSASVRGHMLWPAHIDQATLDDGRQQQPRHSWINNSICMS